MIHEAFILFGDFNQSPVQSGNHGKGKRQVLLTFRLGVESWCKNSLLVASKVRGRGTRLHGTFHMLQIMQSPGAIT